MSDVFRKGIRNKTGVVFGFPGSPLLGVAIERAQAGGRRVAVISAANLATVAPYEENILGAAEVDGDKDLERLVATLTKNKLDDDVSLVFHGIAEYAGRVLNKLCGVKTPEQSQWGEMARQVANDLRQLTALSEVLFVTCEAGLDDDGKPRLNINPGLQKIILGDLNEKIFVSVRSIDGVQTTVVQDNPTLALAFTPPKRERAAEPATEGDAPKPARLGGARRIR